MRSPTLVDVLCIAVAGGLGTLARFGVGIGAQRLLGDGFPFGTLAVNLLGCFLMGLASYLGAKTQTAPPFLFPALTIGFLGGLTTFSAFGNETFGHLAAGRSTVALGNIAANVCLGLVAVWAGQLAAKGIVAG